MPFDTAGVKDGPEIAGIPSKTFQGTAPIGGKEYAADAFAAANENGTYFIVALESNPALLEGGRTQTLPEILKSAVVEP